MNVYEKVSDVRTNIRAALTVVISTVIAGQAWYAIDPQPGPLTRAVRNADDPFISGWVLLLAAAAAGIVLLAWFVVGAALPKTSRGKTPAVIGTTAVVALFAGAVTGLLAEGAAVALLLAVASSWVVPKPAATG